MGVGRLLRDARRGLSAYMVTPRNHKHKQDHGCFHGQKERRSDSVELCKLTERWLGGEDREGRVGKRSGPGESYRPFMGVCSSHTRYRTTHTRTPMKKTSL